jgi:hypothetical protein
MKKSNVIGFNLDYLKRVPKDTFINDHKDAHPEDVLAEAWNTANAKPEKPAKTVKVDKAE